VRHDVEACHLGLVGHRGDLLLGILIGRDAVGWGRHTTVRHDLDVMRTLADFIAHGASQLGDAVAQARDAGYPIGWVLVILSAGPIIAVPAGGRQGLAAVDDTRPLDTALGHGPRYAEVSSARIAHRGETAMQHAPRDFEGACSGIQRRLDSECRQVRCALQDVAMAVDQAGHDGKAFEIQAPRIRGFQGRCPHLDNLRILQHDTAVGLQLAGVHVDNRGVLQDGQHVMS